MRVDTAPAGAYPPRMTSHPEAEPRKNKTGAERRRWPRAESELSVTILLDGRPHQAKLRDVSRAGVCFYLERPVALMTVLSLSLDLAVDGRARKIRGQGAVVRCERIGPNVAHYEVALYLHDMPETDRALLDEHVRSRMGVA